MIFKKKPPEPTTLVILSRNIDNFWQKNDKNDNYLKLRFCVSCKKLKCRLEPFGTTQSTRDKETDRRTDRQNP